MSLAVSSKQLLSQFKDLVSESVESLKRSSSEAKLHHLREIKKMKREESRSFNRKGSELQFKFNAKLYDCLVDSKSHPESNAVEKASSVSVTAFPRLVVVLLVVVLGIR